MQNELSTFIYVPFKRLNSNKRFVFVPIFRILFEQDIVIYCSFRNGMFIAIELEEFKRRAFFNKFD